MLTCKDLVIVKNEKGEVIKTSLYDRVYLDFGPNDAVKDVEKNGIKIQVPKESKSTHASQELMDAAIAFLEVKKPNADPNMVMLEETSYALDLRERATVRAALLPPKPVDIDKATDKAAKLMVSLGLFPTLDAAVAHIRAMKSGTPATDAGEAETAA